MKTTFFSTLALCVLALGGCSQGGPLLDVNMSSFTTNPQLRTGWQIPQNEGQPLAFQSDDSLWQECLNNPPTPETYNLRSGLVTSALVSLNDIAPEAAFLRVSLRYHSQLTSPASDPVTPPPVTTRGVVTVTSPQPQATSDIPLGSEWITGEHREMQALTFTIPRPASQTLLISLGVEYRCRMGLNPTTAHPEQSWQIDSITIAPAL